MPETAAPPQWRREAGAREQVGNRNPEIPEGDYYGGVLTGWEIIKGLLIGDT